MGLGVAARIAAESLASDPDHLRCLRDRCCWSPINAYPQSICDPIHEPTDSTGHTIRTSVRNPPRLVCAPPSLLCRLQALITSEVPSAVVHGHPDHRLPNTLSIAFPGVLSSHLLQDIRGEVAASAGAACHRCARVGLGLEPLCGGILTQ